MKNILLIFAVIIFIPFFVVVFWKENFIKYDDIKLKYLSSGIVRVKREDNTIDNVFLEDYVVGVVAGEMPVLFEFEALKAQSVASRTYVLNKLNKNNEREYDVLDTVSNQVYLDNEQLKIKWGDDYNKYIDRIRTAVNETSMEYLEYNGEIIDALFFSTSNGFTEDAKVVFSSDVPYLKSVDSIWDEDVATTFYTSTNISLQEFYDKLGLEFSKKLKVDVLKRSSSNRIVSLKINDKEFNGSDVYNKLKLRSCDFEFIQIGSNVEIKTKGYGHGVGMSQYGAHGMAKVGYSYREILAHYYTDTKLKKLKS